MKNEIFTNISKIIERDSKVTTYKFALLRGVIDIIQDNSPYISIAGDRVHFPLGLLIEKWMIYYYPILESSIAIPQINVKRNLSPLRSRGLGISHEDTKIQRKINFSIKFIFSHSLDYQYIFFISF